MDLIIPNSGPKYSEAFVKLVKPFIESLPDDIDIETICELGQFAWNTSVMMKKDPAIIPSFKSLFSSMAINQDEKEMNEVFQKMIEEKNTIFPEYENCIGKFELREDASGELIIKTLSQSYEDYVKNLNNSLSNSDDNFLNSNMPGYINRTALIVSFKKPFLDWISSLGIEQDKELLSPFIFLIDENKDTEYWLAKNFKMLFKSSLNRFCQTKGRWPKKLNRKLFDEWFTIEESDMILDIEMSPIIKTQPGIDE
jgi:hypothetical protein